MAKGLYIHIPFCHVVCAYCDFPKLAGAENFIGPYVQALIRELKAYSSECAEAETVYIGGGTPSAIGIPALSALFDGLETVVRWKGLSEITLEANPGDLTPEMARFLASRGVNRVSLGVQTSHPRLLKILGRQDGPASVIQAVRNLKEAGIANLNLDFIYAIPTQTLAELERDIDFACSLKPTHLSFYSLILEEKTQLMYDIRHGKYRPLDEELEATMFETVMDRLPKEGFLHYEISNFARPGWQSKHNMIYWNVQSYVGLGMGAHSQIQTERFHNHSTISSYLSTVETTGIGREAIDDCDLSMETGLMTLRLMEGIGLQNFQERFGVDIFKRYPLLSKNIAQGLLEVTEGHLRLTRRGILLMNQVERSFLERAC